MDSWEQTSEEHIEQKRIKQNLKDIRNVAICFGVACLVLAGACGYAVYYLIQDQKRSKTESVQPKENKIVNMQNTLKITNFVRQR